MILEVKECYKLDLTDPASQGWQAIAPMLKARFNFNLVAANGLLFAIGGEGPFFDHDDIEVGCVTIDKIFTLCRSSRFSDL